MKEERDALNQIRLERDLTYDALAAEIGMSHHALYRFLARHGDPRDRNAYKIRRYLEAKKAQAAA